VVHGAAWRRGHTREPCDRHSDHPHAEKHRQGLGASAHHAPSRSIQSPVARHGGARAGTSPGSVRSVHVDWASPVPAPEQIADVLLAEIAAGRHAVASTLPTLVELCTRFDVSRGTVSRALRILRDEKISGGRGSRGLMVLKRPR
jgi:Bacterial regulatory proteins, gntR family